MRRTLTSALPHATPGEQVRLQGWVHRRRELAKVTFLVVRDRTGLAQVVLPAGTDAAAGGDAGRGRRPGHRTTSRRPAASRSPRRP